MPCLDEGKIEVLVPPGSHSGSVIRLKGLGRRRDFTWRAPFLRREHGDLLVKLHVYPDAITPRYGSFDTLDTGDMALEGWVYCKIDEIAHRAGAFSFAAKPLQAEAVANRYSEAGWRGIFPVLVDHLQLAHCQIEVTSSDSIPQPGLCQKTVTHQSNGPASSRYLITIGDRFLDNPFSVAAIIAHELCHVMSSEVFRGGSGWQGYGTKQGDVSLEEERTVDLLVFMSRIGGFQLRVSRDERLTLGYFNQPVFERMQVIVTRKLSQQPER